MEWERGFLEVARSRLLVPLTKIKLQPHTKPPTPTSSKLKRNGPLYSDVTLTMFYRYASCATGCNDCAAFPHSPPSAITSPEPLVSAELQAFRGIIQRRQASSFQPALSRGSR